MFSGHRKGVCSYNLAQTHTMSQSMCALRVHTRRYGSRLVLDSWPRRGACPWGQRHKSRMGFSCYDILDCMLCASMGAQTPWPHAAALYTVVGVWMGRPFGHILNFALSMAVLLNPYVAFAHGTVWSWLISGVSLLHSGILHAYICSKLLGMALTHIYLDLCVKIILVDKLYRSTNIFPFKQCCEG